jgi:hypothetical protein
LNVRRENSPTASHVSHAISAIVSSVTLIAMASCSSSTGLPAPAPTPRSSTTAQRPPAASANPACPSAPPAKTALPTARVARIILCWTEATASPATNRLSSKAALVSIAISSARSARRRRFVRSARHLIYWMGNSVLLVRRSRFSRMRCVCLV